MSCKLITTFIAVLAMLASLTVPAVSQSPYDMQGSQFGTPYSPYGLQPTPYGTQQSSSDIGQSQLPTDVSHIGIARGNEPGSSSYYESRYRSAVVNNVLTFQKKMNTGRVAFGRHMESQYFNTRYWEPVNIEGSQFWKIKDGMSRKAAFDDFIGAGGGKYKLDCAAAINLILIKSKMDVVGEPNFNKHLPDLMIRGWKTYYVKDGNYTEIETLEKWSGNEMSPGGIAGLKTGDYVYFKNHPMMEGTPEQGENAIYLGTDVYGRPAFFGLNIGIFRGTVNQYGILTSERGSIDPENLKKMAET